MWNAQLNRLHRCTPYRIHNTPSLFSITTLLLGLLLLGSLPQVAEAKNSGKGGPKAAAIRALIERVDALEAENTAQNSQIVALQAEIANQDARLATLENNANTLASVLFVNEFGDVVIEGANLFVQNGSGGTSFINGKGNLIIGYDEAGGIMGSGGPFTSEEKTGSHNLVIGWEHSYTNFGGLVAGRDNAITGQSATVSGGQRSIASGPSSSVSGGDLNKASGPISSVSGGGNNTASGDRSSVSGGNGNTASGIRSWVSGGSGNTANAFGSSVSGGFLNSARGTESSVSGGSGNRALADFSSVSGGTNCDTSVRFAWGAGVLIRLPVGGIVLCSHAP